METRDLDTLLPIDYHKAVWEAYNGGSDYFHFLSVSGKDSRYTGMANVYLSELKSEEVLSFINDVLRGLIEKDEVYMRWEEKDPTTGDPQVHIFTPLGDRELFSFNPKYISHKFPEMMSRFLKGYVDGYEEKEKSFLSLRDRFVITSDQYKASLSSLVEKAENLESKLNSIREEIDDISEKKELLALRLIKDINKDDGRINKSDFDVRLEIKEVVEADTSRLKIVDLASGKYLVDIPPHILNKYMGKGEDTLHFFFRNYIDGIYINDKLVQTEPPKMNIIRACLGESPERPMRINDILSMAEKTVEDCCRLPGFGIINTAENSSKCSNKEYDEI